MVTDYPFCPLACGYDPNAVIRTHEERLAAMLASRRVLPGDLPNTASQASGRYGASVRDSESFRRGIANRDMSTTMPTDPEVSRGVVEMKRVFGLSATRRRLGISFTTVERAIAGKRVRIDIHARIAAALANTRMEAEPRMMRPDEVMRARLVDLVTEEGSQKSAAARMGIGTRTLQKALAGEYIGTDSYKRAVACLNAPRPEDWKTGAERLEEARQRRRKANYDTAERGVCERAVRQGTGITGEEQARALDGLRRLVEQAGELAPVATRLGMSEQYISRILRGRFAPGLSVLTKIAALETAVAA